MKWITYEKYEGDDLGLTAEDLLAALADTFLDSGFASQSYPGFENSLSDLKDAIRRALQAGQWPDTEKAREIAEKLAEMDEPRIETLLEKLVQKLIDEGYIQLSEPPGTPGEGGSGDSNPKFEVSGKAVDFLGFKTFKDLLGAVGKSSFGAHDTREMSTGVDSSGSSKRYEFGDTLNLDVSETLFSALRRNGIKERLEIEYQDLHVHQSEYQSSCATVVMLDCSHSMILYGEDRFTPAKRVALALAHLLKTQYPGDSLRFVLFHDSAEEVRLSQLAQVQVGPYYTNTRAGLMLAQRLLAQEKKDMRQIIMITDGKPSALTLDDGQIYKNPFAMDPLVISRTLEEVNRCKRQGILINTFMLASDYSLVRFVQQVTEICKGKAYFTTAQTLGQYLLMDYMNRKSRMVN